MMRVALAAILALVPAAPVAAQEGAHRSSAYAVDLPMTGPDGMHLVFDDEFDGVALDLTKWRYETDRNRYGWYNGELQYYSGAVGTRANENVRVNHGHLLIEARRERLDSTRRPDWGGQAYTSARLRSNIALTYGLFEVRAKLPCGRGMWPAIWMLPNRGKWPDDGEIDIMEHVGAEPGLVHATLHTALYNHSRGTGRGATTSVPTACDAYHVYALDWQRDAISIGVDGRAYMRVANDAAGGEGAWPFDAPFQMILNLAVGGGWAAASGVDDHALPQRLDLDYVRVWQR